MEMSEHTVGQAVAAVESEVETVLRLGARLLFFWAVEVEFGQ